MKAFLIIPLVLIATISLAQNYIPYTKDRAVSDSKGLPYDHRTAYFPEKYFNDTTRWVYRLDKDSTYNVRGKYLRILNPDCTTKTPEDYAKKEGIDAVLIKDTTTIELSSLRMEWYSGILHQMYEPVLYNYNSGNEEYRFTWLRSFDRPVVIRLEKRNNEYCLYLKALDREPGVDAVLVMDINDRTKDSLVRANNTTIHLETDTVVKLSKEDYDQFMVQIHETAIIYQPHILRRSCTTWTDGAHWIFEVATNKGYYFIDRHVPRGNDPVKRIGMYLIKLSGLKGEEIY